MMMAWSGIAADLLRFWVMSKVIPLALDCGAVQSTQMCAVAVNKVDRNDSKSIVSPLVVVAVALQQRALCGVLAVMGGWYFSFVLFLCHGGMVGVM